MRIVQADKVRWTERNRAYECPVSKGAVLAALPAANCEVVTPAIWEVEHEGEYRRTKDETSRVQIPEILRANL